MAKKQILDLETECKKVDKRVIIQHLPHCTAQITKYGRQCRYQGATIHYDKTDRPEEIGKRNDFYMCKREDD